MSALFSVRSKSQILDFGSSQTNTCIRLFVGFCFTFRLALWPVTFFRWRVNWRLHAGMWLLHSERANRASLTLWERLLMYKQHECCSAAGRKPGQAVTYVSYDKLDDHIPLTHPRVKCSDKLTFTLQLSIKYWAMDLTKASKKYQEYCRTDKHQPESHKKRF